MDIERKINKFKIIYQNTKPSENFLKHGWQDLQDRIVHLEAAQAKKRFFNMRPFAFAVLIFFILSGLLNGIVQASQKTLPGQPLYPVKRISEEILFTVSGNPTVKMENRAKEVVELNKKSGPKEVQKAVEEYKKAVDEASNSGKNKDEIEEKLQEQEAEFEQIKQGTSEKEINQAIEISKSGRGNQESENKNGENKEEESEENSDSNSDRSFK